MNERIGSCLEIEIQHKNKNDNDTGLCTYRRRE